MRTLAQDRDQIIAEQGEENFKLSPFYSDLADIPPPPCFSFIFSTFLEIYNHCIKEGISWADIDAYSRVRDLRLQQVEIDYIMKCNVWASEEISELHKSEDE